MENIVQINSLNLSNIVVDDDVHVNLKRHFKKGPIRKLNLELCHDTNNKYFSYLH